MALRDQPRVLVTGGAGILGNFLCEWLVQDWDDMICVDHPYPDRREQITFHLTQRKSFKALCHDIAFLYGEVDQIFSLAKHTRPAHGTIDARR